MSHSIRLSVLLCFLIFHKITDATLLKWSNLKCYELKHAKDFCHIENCRLKAVRRNYVEMNFKMALYKVPLANITMNLQLLKKVSNGGFLPFLYNINFNFCKLMKNINYPLSFEKYVFDMVRPFSNINTSCPLTMSHIIIDKFVVPSDMIKLPVPSGVYRLQFTVLAYNLSRIATQIQIHIQE